MHVLLKLSELGWKPALLESQVRFLECADIPIEKLTQIWLNLPPYYRPRGVNGDIFFVGDGEVFFLLIASRSSYMEGYWEERFSEPPVHLAQESRRPQIILGVISSTSEELDQRLNEFIVAVETAIKSIGRQNETNEAFRWEEVSLGTSSLSKLRNEAASREIRFEEPELGADYINAAYILVDAATRELLIEISQAGFVLERDLLGRKRKDSEKIQAILEKARQGGLVTVDYVLECKKEGKVLTRLSSQEQINVPGVAELKCPFCNSSFGQEKLSMGYSLSQLGDRMLHGSHWMNVLVTSLLVNLGIPQSSILWYVSEAGGEVDILAEVMESLWIFELKDKEFGAGDAYALNYRRVMYDVDRTVVITTDRVSLDAKRVLEGVQSEGSRYRKRRNDVIYIEGHEQVKELLTKEVSLSRLRYVQRLLVPLGEFSGYNLGKVLSLRFGIED